GGYLRPPLRGGLTRPRPGGRRSRVGIRAAVVPVADHVVCARALRPGGIVIIFTDWRACRTRATSPPRSVSARPPAWPGSGTGPAAAGRCGIVGPGPRAGHAQRRGATARPHARRGAGVRLAVTAGARQDT